MTFKYKEVEMELDGAYVDIMVTIDEDGIIECVFVIDSFPKILEISPKILK